MINVDDLENITIDSNQLNSNIRSGSVNHSIYTKIKYATRESPLKLLFLQLIAIQIFFMLVFMLV